MSEIESIKFQLEESAAEGNTAELPTLKLSDVVDEATDSEVSSASRDAEATTWVADMESEIESLRQRWQEVDAALHRSENRTIELERQLAEKDESARERDEAVAAAHKQVEKLEAELARMQQRDGERDESVRELNRSLQSQTSLTEMLRADLTRRDSELQDIKSELLAATAKIQSKDRKLDARDSKLSELESRIAEQDRQIVAFRNEQAEMQDELQELRKDLKLKQSMIDAFDKSARRLTDLNRSMKRRSAAPGPGPADGLIIQAAHIFELAAAGDQDASGSMPARFRALPDGVQHMMVCGSGSDRQFYPLTQQHITIGRARDCDICIADETISRVHARLTLGPDGFEIADAGSTNGIRVNDKEVKNARLRHGDTVSLAGTLKLTFVDVASADDSA
jgi:peptidoglycan hydrolase CwlO-like protein